MTGRSPLRCMANGVCPAKKGAIDLRYDAVLFVCGFGTLVHSSPGVLETMRHTFRQMGVDPEYAGICNRFSGPPLRKHIL